MKPLVLYYTNYNTTKDAAEIIAKHFNISDIFNINDFDQANITNYDTLFLGSNVRALKVGKPVKTLLKKIKKEEISIKILLFLIAGTPDPTGLDVAKKLKRKNESIMKITSFNGRMFFKEMTIEDQKMIETFYDMMKRELKDYNDFKEEQVINFCKEVEGLLK